jgi:uncharacterized membrane protein|tara:strand:- start:825 stop:1223 length:399 start_codon:yes stop_codon:yes gene_type:complete
MEESMGFIEVAAWFLGGALAHSFLTKLMGYYHSVQILEDVTEHLLRMIGTVVGDITYVRKKKYDSLKEMKYTEKQIEDIMEFDEKGYYNWKTSLVVKLIANYPRKFRNLLTFHDWDSAMKELDNIYKKESKT